jgi:carboxyl-terminal processing protease
LFWDVWQIVEQEFYREKPLDYHEMVYGAIRGMVNSLGDPHTAFLTPSQREMFSQDLEGEFGGIGVTVHMTDEGKLMAMKTLAGSPAEHSDIKAGDLILEVDGTSLQDKDVSQAISMIRGPSGSQVRLLIQRGSEAPFEVVLTRAVVSIPTVESRMLQDGIAYLSLAEFNAKATAGVRAALAELLKQNPRGLILDLRGNPGGYLHVADEVASEFLADGVTVTERGRDGAEVVHKASPGGKATKIPLAVLVDAGSASASEIVAGAIQDHNRGILVGEKTYGKGSVQITQSLSDGSGLQVTIRRWYTPAGHQIDGVGLTPDIPVTVSEEDLQALRDPALQRAVTYLLSQTPQ